MIIMDLFVISIINAIIVLQLCTNEESIMEYLIIIMIIVIINGVYLVEKVIDSA